MRSSCGSLDGASLWNNIGRLTVMTNIQGLTLCRAQYYLLGVDYSVSSSEQRCEGGVSIPISEVRKLRAKQVKRLAQACRAGGQQSQRVSKQGGWFYLLTI